MFCNILDYDNVGVTNSLYISGCGGYQNPNQESKTNTELESLFAILINLNFHMEPNRC